jgi:hypothetical protein
MAKKDNVSVLDPLAGRMVLDEHACDRCNSYKGTLKAIGRGRFSVICTECGLPRAQIGGREVFSLIRELRAMPGRRLHSRHLPPAA